MDPSYNGNFNGANPGGMNPGGFPGNNMPISSGTGDVVLSGGQEKPGKKSFIVLIVLAVILVVVGVVFVVFNPLSPASLNGQSGGQLSASQAFARYSNYFLYGEDSVEMRDGEDLEMSKTAFMRHASDEDVESRTSYYSNLRDLYKTFYDIYNSGDQIDEAFVSFLNEYGIKLSIMTYRYSGNTVNRQEILDAYSSGDEQSAEVLIESKLSPYKGLGDVYGLNYYDLAYKSAEADKEAIVVYDSFGCVAGKTIDYGCASQNVNEKTMAINETSSEVFYKMQTILTNSENSLFMDVVRIKSGVEKEPTEMEQNNEND